MPCGERPCAGWQHSVLPKGHGRTPGRFCVSCHVGWTHRCHTGDETQRLEDPGSAGLGFYGHAPGFPQAPSDLSFPLVSVCLFLQRFSLASTKRFSLASTRRCYSAGCRQERSGCWLSGDERLVLSPSGQLCEAESCSLVKHNNETFLIFDTAACLLVILKS